MKVVGRSLRRGLAALILASIALCVLAPAASAHAFLVRSDPPAGATLPSGPGVVRLWFSEEVSRALSSARLVAADGRTIAGVQLPASSDPRSLTVELPSLSSGSYGLFWRLLDEDDGHTTSGVLVFHVGAASRATVFAASGAGSSDPPVDVALHWLAFCALAGVIGALGMGVFVIGRAERRDPSPLLRAALQAARRRLTVLGAVCAAAGTLVGLAIVIAVARRLTQPGSGGSLAGTLGALLTTRWGSLWLVREIALVALAGALFLIASRRPGPAEGAARRPLQALAGGLALTAVITQALGSHAATLDSGRPLAIVADGLHLLTACLWLGSLPTLLLLLWPKPQSVGRRALVRSCRVPFSWLAGTSFCLVAATGLYSAGRQVETVGAVASTSYGRTLLVKSLIVAAVGALGLVNALRLHGWRPGRVGRRVVPKVGARSPSLRLITLESAMGIVLLLVASVLIGTPPARGPVLAPSAASATRTVYGSVDDLIVSISVTPNRPGVNGFTLLAASSRRPPPAPVEDVALQLERGGTTGVVTLKEIETGRYFGTGTMDEAGRWELTALIRRAGHTLAARVDLRISKPTISPVLERPGPRLAPLVDGLAVIVLAGGVVVAVTARRRAGRSRTGHGRGPEAEASDDIASLDAPHHEASDEDDDMHALAGARGEGP
jgi:copper transport protein